MKIVKIGELTVTYNNSQSSDGQIFYSVEIKLPNYISHQAQAHHVYAKTSANFFPGVNLINRKKNNMGKTHDYTYTMHTTQIIADLADWVKTTIPQINAGLLAIKNDLIKKQASLDESTILIKMLAETTIPATPLNIAAISAAVAVEERKNTLELVRRKLSGLRYGKQALNAIATL